MKIFAPVSIGNFSVGFDLLGLAITPINGELLGDVVSIKSSEKYQLTCSGPYADVLPKNSEANLVTLAHDKYMQKMKQRGKSVTPVSLHLEKRLPVGSGLGSSSSSAVAALYALNKFFGESLSIDDLLLLAGELEGEVSGSIHYDNVAPCLLGGLQLMTGVEHHPCVSVPFPESWQLVVSYPGIKIATKEARQILPNVLNLSTSIKFAQNLSVFVHALNSEDQVLAASVLFDVIAEPTRKSLIPGFESYRDFSKSMGALAFGISGSGSTVFAVTNSLSIANKIQQYALNKFCQKGGFSHICKVDNFGVRQIKDIMKEA
ncbi:MAG: homoserine kinase [Marinicellaceae bacterium]